MPFCIQRFSECERLIYGSVSIEKAFENIQESAVWMEPGIFSWHKEQINACICYVLLDRLRARKNDGFSEQDIGA